MAISDNPGPNEGIEAPGGGEAEHAGIPAPRGGGCLRLGWGCVTLLIGGLLLVPGANLLL